MKKLCLTLLLLLVLAQPVRAYECGEKCSNNLAVRPLTMAERWEVNSRSLTPKEIWVRIVSGEAGGLTDGAQLVAWTLRSWEVYKGMPAELAGPRWGWHGWGEETAVAREAVEAVWNKPLSESPYSWMREGKYCDLLGNDRDLRYWNSLGWGVYPSFRLEWPDWNLAMNCIWER